MAEDTKQPERITVLAEEFTPAAIISPPQYERPWIPHGRSDYPASLYDD